MYLLLLYTIKVKVAKHAIAGAFDWTPLITAPPRPSWASASFVIHAATTVMSSSLPPGKCSLPTGLQ